MPLRLSLPSRRAPAVLAVLAASTLVLAGCGGDGSGAAAPSPSGSRTAPSASSTPTFAVTGSGPAPTVTEGAPGHAPTIARGSGKPSDALVIKVLSTGSGPVAGRGSLVVTDFAVQKWDSAAPLASTYEARLPTSFPLVAGQTIPAWQQLAGVRVGSRVEMVVPPAAGFGTTGNPSAGIAPTDTLVFVFDIRGAYPPGAAASGHPAERPGDGAPTVTMRDGHPVISVPKGARPPATLTSTRLLAGDGARVRAGQTVVVQYTGALWSDGSTFDSSWARGVPAAFPIGGGKVIPGWDMALVGATVGDRLLLVIPPDDAYGAAGKPDRGIPANATLVFVVDVLDAI